MKSIFSIFGIVFYSMLYSQPTYTFHTAGNWTDAANWSPSYPGTTFGGTNWNNSPDFIINANCTVPSGVNLSMVGFSEILSHNNFTIQSNATITGGSIDQYQGGTLDNYGILNGGYINIHNSSFNNFGTNCRSTAFIEAGGTVTNNGTYCVGGWILSYQAPNTFINNSTITGGGTIYIPIQNGANSIYSPDNWISFDISDCVSLNNIEIDIYDNDPINMNGWDVVNANCINLSNSNLDVSWHFTPSVGQVFDILTHGSRTGQFASVNIPPIAGFSFSVDYTDPLKTSIVVSSALPITYSKHLEATQKQNSTYLTWSVATQINNDKYIIEHSKDGRNFSLLGEIEGDGNNTSEKQYTYTHDKPSIGINYYRIKQVDYDGKYSFSNIATVRYDGSGETNIYPNPATSQVNISTTKPTSVQIMDVYGRLLLNRDISDGQNTINISALPSGILIFVVGDQRYRVLKE